MSLAQSLYKDPNQPWEVRRDCMKIAAPYERPALSAVAVKDLNPSPLTDDRPSLAIMLGLAVGQTATREMALEAMERLEKDQAPEIEGTSTPAAPEAPDQAPPPRRALPPSLLPHEPPVEREPRWFSGSGQSDPPSYTDGV